MSLGFTVRQLVTFVHALDAHKANGKYPVLLDDSAPAVAAAFKPIAAILGTTWAANLSGPAHVAVRAAYTGYMARQGFTSIPGDQHDALLVEAMQLRAARHLADVLVTASVETIADLATDTVQADAADRMARAKLDPNFIDGTVRFIRAYPETFDLETDPGGPVHVRPSAGQVPPAPGDRVRTFWRGRMGKGELRYGGCAKLTAQPLPQAGDEIVTLYEYLDELEVRIAPTEVAF